MLPKGDRKPDEIHLEVGRALSHWEGLEFALSELYEALLNADGDGAAAGYGLLTAFTGRHALLEAAEQYFPFRDHVAFLPIRGLIRRAVQFSARRNEIAHGIVCHVHARGYYLTPAWYNTSKAPKSGFDPSKFNGGIGKYAYTADQIAIYSGHFRKLRDEAEALVAEVLAHNRAEP